MLTLKLYQKYCPNKLPVQVGERLGHDGANGEVLSIIGSPEKAIKLSVINDGEVHSKDIYFNRIDHILKYIKTEKPEPLVSIYEHGFSGYYQRDKVNFPFVLHYYIMEKLLKISDDEKKVFHSLISHEDRLIKKDFSNEKIKEILGGLARGLDFDTQKIILFCEQLRNLPIQHNDLHPRNIMLDNKGYYKLIDLDSCSFK